MTQPVHLIADYSIYSLTDPITNEVKYIGSTHGSLDDRLKRHMRSISHDIKWNANKALWLLSLKENGYSPIIELLDIADTEGEMFLLEEYWTYQFRAWGFRLLNKYFGKRMGYENIQKIKKLRAGQKIPIKAIIAASEKRKKSVLQRNLKGEIIGWWKFVTDAEKHLNFKAKGKIIKVCDKKGYIAGGFRWEYCSEETFNIMNKYVVIQSLPLDRSLLTSKGLDPNKNYVLIKKLP